MIWLVVGEGIAVGVLALLVVALAHSYAGLAARVERVGGVSTERAVTTLAAPARAPSTDGTGAASLEGVTLEGERVSLPLTGVGHDTLLAFLSSTCGTCRGLWDALARARADGVDPSVRLVVVTRGPDRESLAALDDLASGRGDVDVVLSSACWEAFGVPGSPYFVLVGGASGTVLGEGTALSWAQVADLVRLSARDAGAARRLGTLHDRPRGDRRREGEVDRLLMEAGVLPGDPSLYRGAGDVP